MRSREKPTPKQHGFDYWFATGNNAQPSHKDPVNFIRNGKPVGKIKGYASQIVVNEAISWLDEHRNPAKPFFLNIWFHEPHAPIAAPKTSVAPYGKLNDPAAIYSGTIDNTDRAIARLLKKLKQVDAPENTLIIYSSDNGSYRNDRTGHLRGSKGSNFEGGIRVPGIFYWPGTIGGERVEKSPAGLVDLLPSVCGLLGIDKPEGVHLDGSDLSPLLRGEPDKFSRHQPLLWLLPTNAGAIALREGKYSLVGYRTNELPKGKQAMASIRKQIELFFKVAQSLSMPVKHIKLHGKLYNEAAKEEKLANLFLKVVSSFDKNLSVIGPANSLLERMTMKASISFIPEAFIDRRYREDYRLVDRNQEGAVLESIKDQISQAKSIVLDQKVLTDNKKNIDIKAETLCIHGDNPNYLKVVRAVCDMLKTENINIQPYSS